MGLHVHGVVQRWIQVFGGGEGGARMVGVAGGWVLLTSGQIRKAGRGGRGGAVGFWPHTKSGGEEVAVGFWPDTKSGRGGMIAYRGARDIVQ